MPLRYSSILLLPLLTAPGLHAEEALNWVERDTMEALDPEIRKPIDPWCEGTYFNPLFAASPETRDTVITAERTSLVEGGLAELSGRVEIRQPERRLLADTARFDQTSGDFSLNGDIRVEMPTLTFLAEDLKGNTKTREAELENARYALFDLHARGAARRVEHAGDITLIERGSYTTCPPDSRVWLLSAADIKLDREEGWGEATNVLLRIQRVPVLWVPWITFPIDDRRKTGLLFPTIASSNAGGVDITQPVYLNLHPQFDATLAPRHIHGRGNGLESEFRYLTEVGMGTASYSWLNKDREFDDEDRVLASWRHNGGVKRWLFRSDVNYVSDDFYLKDLESGIDIAATTYLPRIGEARYLGRTWRFLARVQSWQIIDPLLPESDLPFRRLPQLQLLGSPTLAGPLDLDWVSDYTFFDRNADLPTDEIAAHRLHLEPALTLRLENDWGYLEPRARLYHTQYRLEGLDTRPDETPTRDLWGFNVDAGVVFERLLEEPGLIQTLEPRIFFNHIPYEDQSELPLLDADELTPSYAALFRENRFTGYDRIGDEQSTTLALSSRFLEQNTGNETLRLRVAQKIYEKDRRIQIEGDVETDRTSPLISEASMRLNEQWHLEVFNHWNSSLNRRERNGLRLGYQHHDRLLNAGLTDRPRDDILQSELAAVVPIGNHWQVLGRWFYDMVSDESLETLAGFEYRSCCWRLRMVNIRELSDTDGDGRLDADATWMMQIVLSGLGGFGGRIDSLLERSIPGFRSLNHDN